MSSEPFEYDDKGRLIINLCATEADGDWLHARRLKIAADQGDTEAQAEFDRMQNSPMGPEEK